MITEDKGTNGKRELLLQKKKKADVSYSNINRSQMNIKDSEVFFSNIDIRRKNNDFDCNNKSYTGNLTNLKNVQSNTITPLESNKISRANSRHSANPNHD